MARTIPHRELRNNSSKILEEVRNGETIHITNHGVVVATLVPPTSTPPPLNVRPAVTPGSWRDIVPEASPAGPITQEYWDDVRGDRL